MKRGPKPKPLPQQLQDLEHLKKLSKSMCRYDMAKFLDVDYEMLCGVLRKNNIEPVKDMNDQRYFLQWYDQHHETVLEMCDSGCSAFEISEHLPGTGTKYKYVLKILKMHDRKLLKQGTSRKSTLSQKRTLKTFTYEFLYNLYVKEEKTIKYIAGVADVTIKNVAQEMERHGIQMRTRSEQSAIIWRDPKLRQANREKANIGLIGVFMPNRKSKSTSIENIFENWCTNMNLVFEKQFQIQKGGHRYDFLLPEYNLLVECDGEYWHSSEEQKKKDKMFDDCALDAGYDIIRLLGKELTSGKFEQIINARLEKVVL